MDSSDAKKVPHALAGADRYLTGKPFRKDADGCPVVDADAYIGYPVGQGIPSGSMHQNPGSPAPESSVSHQPGKPYAGGGMPKKPSY